MYEQLPKQLRDYPYFGLWKYEQKDGRRTKVPKTVRGYNANSKNLKQFCGLDEVTENEYSRAAEPPVRCGESHMSGLTGATLL